MEVISSSIVYLTLIDSNRIKVSNICINQYFMSSLTQCGLCALEASKGRLSGEEFANV